MTTAEQQAFARRFYEAVTVSDGDAPHQVLLDGRPVRTPGRAALALSTRQLAEAIAGEWSAQSEKVDPASMPLTQIACTALDRVADQRAGVIETIVRYGQSDLICYFADGPDDLQARQKTQWQPVLDWLASTHGITLKTTTGLMAVEQSPDALSRFSEIVSALDSDELAAFGVLVSAMGSIALALAVSTGFMSPKAALDAALVDEIYQAELWGRDKEAEDRRESLLYDVMAASTFLGLHRAR